MHCVTIWHIKPYMMKKSMSFINAPFYLSIFLSVTFFLAITSIEIYSDQTNDKYYVGEDVTITAKFNNPFQVLFVKWQFNGNSLRNTIDTELPKYAETRYENNNHLLVIKNCCALDAGEYFLVATCRQEKDICSKNVGICRDSVDICSNKLHLKVGQGKFRLS